ncbi:uncharacterized protein LOC124612415 isoform X2 [Schistocerca americana]|uniref:uncharacterized protein LOC124612415 isoform X2 n=1 Tax=Schistocerca americana TaxID=7009 RepID=UPI001F4FD1AE|nr:uncharacterized protein LOC124612415 isoform X2 [Schistocerca americana]XP_047114474.1 uncharacterized protein LOC124794852 isoform X2 [Schistocerca piceifrons]XP_049785157.1 uncharacterized protein LOC126187871 isoform X2 [Schistocerca cancellata]
MPLPPARQMENPAFERDGSVAGSSGVAAVRSVELGAVEAPPPSNGVVCTDLCRTQLPPLPHKQPPSPWNRLKTVFLATIIAILVVWVIVFTTLSQLGYF